MMRRETGLLLAAVLTISCRPAAAPPSTTSSSSPPAEASDEPEASGPAEPEPDEPGRISVGGAVIRVEYEGNALPVSTEVSEAWVRRSATMVADYLGEFPVPDLEVTLSGRGWGDVGFGMHDEGRWITVYCGRSTEEADLVDDWVLVHEMLHAAFPDLARSHRWMQEGLSTYLEPIVRARAGNTTERTVWRRWTRSMHHGRPRAGDRGLDLTHTWGRTYWGGALFWLMVDVELRIATDGQKSIRDVVRGILAAGGNGRADWSTKKVVAVADEATGTTVVSEVYARMAEAPGDVDLDALYERLGVGEEGGEIVFDDQAPLAHVRRAITR